MSKRDLRTLRFVEGQQIEYNEVMNKRSELEYRNLSTLAKIALFDEGIALITNGLRVEAYSGMQVKVPTGTLIQKEIDVYGTCVGACIQIEDQIVTVQAADGVARTDIIEGQIITTADRNDYGRIGAVATGGAGAGSVAISTESIQRDKKYSLSVRAQKGTTTPTAATAGTLTGLVAIAGTIDLSSKYLIRLVDGEDGDWQDIDCRGATPAATTRAEIIAAINAAVGRTMAATGAGNVVELTGLGTGETSYFSVKAPVSDSTADAFEEIFGYSIAGLYQYEYRGTNSWIKLAELDIGTATTTITSGLIRNVDDKYSWASEADNVILGNPIFDDPIKIDNIEKRTGKSGDVVVSPGLQVNWIRAEQIGNDLNISGSGSPALAALNGTDVAFFDSGNKDLRTYRFSGTTWAQVGNDLNIAGSSVSTLAALNGTDIAFIDSLADDLRCYRFDGTDWAQVGNDLNIAGIGDAALAALNSTDVAFIDGTNKDLRVYRFDGTDWAQVGNDLNITGCGVAVALAALNSTDVAFIDSTNQDLRCYRFDSTDWTQIGNDLNIASVSTPAATALNGSEIAFIDSANDDLRVYRFAFFISSYPHNPTNSSWV